MVDSVREGTDGVRRCTWCAGDTLYMRYHDEEWGRPVLDDQRLFEKVSLEGFQAGLSWITILRKRENFRAVFHGFDVQRVASMSELDVGRLLSDAGIIRHRGKIEAVINNARCFERDFSTSGEFTRLVWSFAPESAEHDFASGALPSSTALSTALSKDLRRRGWKFVGPTTMYAFMQSMGLVNDHFVGCHVRDGCDRERDAARLMLQRG